MVRHTHLYYSQYDPSGWNRDSGEAAILVPAFWSLPSHPNSLDSLCLLIFCSLEINNLVTVTQRAEIRLTDFPCAAKLKWSSRPPQPCKDLVTKGEAFTADLHHCLFKLGKSNKCEGLAS